MKFIKKWWNKFFPPSTPPKKEVNPIDEAIDRVKPTPSEAPTLIVDQIAHYLAKYLAGYSNLVKENPSLEYWQAVLKAMAKAESNFSPTSRYVETGISDRDLVTGKPNVSEGIFQMSYQDAKLHGCPFNWELDKNKGPLDPSKTIFNIQNQVIAALIVLNKQLEIRKTLITEGRPYYWAVLDTSRPGHKNYLAALKQYYFPTKVEPKPEQPSAPTVSKIKKVAIIVGHGAGDSGAAGQGTNEFAYNSEVAKIVESLSNIHGKTIKLFWRDSRGIKGVNSDAEKWGGDLTLELHLNSYNGSAVGCEVLTLKDRPSVLLGQSFARAFCGRFDRVMRNQDGVKELSSSDRGHYSLQLVDDAPPSILVEPFFIDNKKEWIDPKVYASFVVDWLSKL